MDAGESRPALLHTDHLLQGKDVKSGKVVDNIVNSDTGARETGREPRTGAAD